MLRVGWRMGTEDRRVGRSVCADVHSGRAGHTAHMGRTMCPSLTFTDPVDGRKGRRQWGGLGLAITLCLRSVSGDC